MRKETALTRLEEIRDRVHSAVINRIDFTREIGDTEVLDLIDEELIRSRTENGLDIASMKTLRQDLFHSIRRLDVLQDLIDSDEITEIMINGPDRIFIEKGGGLIPCQGAFSRSSTPDCPGAPGSMSSCRPLP